MSIIGVDLLNPTVGLTDGKSFSLGDRYVAQDGKEYVYVQADGAITGVGYVCVIDENYQAAMLSTSNDARGDHVGVAPVAFANDEYGWLQIKGPCVLRVNALAAANARLNTTSTAGQIDDDATVGSFSLEGIYLTTVQGGAAGNGPGILNYPFISVVL